MKTPRLLIVGLDAATFDLISPWIAEGKIPNLAALVKNGAWSRLASILPSITPPAWTSFMTGKNPGKCERSRRPDSRLVGDEPFLHKPELS
jgi:predicted AlkP superfamily phosphohydrolase/phosphomutase